METSNLKVLFLEDSLHDMELLCEMLTNAGYVLDIIHVDNELDYTKNLNSHQFDIILSDFSLVGFDAFGALEISKQICPDTPFICVSGSIGEETAIELLKLGAVDYVFKDRPERLPYAIKRALDETKTKIAHQKAAEELRESEEKFRNIFQLHSAINLLIDPQDGHIVDANKAASEFYEWSIEELKSMTIFQINTLDSNLLRNEMHHILDTNKNQFEFIHRKSDGSTVDVEVYSSKITIKGIPYLYSIIHDISDKKKFLLDLLAAKEKAEESDRLKTAFIHNISHEIRTPLNSILGFGQYLSEADLPQNERIEMFDHLQKSSTRLMNTVDDYVDIAMIVTSTMKVNKKEFIVQPFFDEFIADTFYLFNHLKIEYIVDTPIQSSNLALFSDKELIRKILLKLLDNAIKFTSRGSISCGYKVLDESIEFFVKDTGKGIAQEKIDMIFKMFSQEESSMTRGYEGSGLGLTISKGLLNLLGGEIQVSSVKGIGSNFSFRIPFKTIETQTNPDEDLKLFDNQNKPVILVAEDDELNYMYMETLFNRNGFEFFHVENGLEAVELCKENPQINIVFMDIKMPVMNGLEATKLIRGFRPDLPIIATTAYAQTGDEERFLSEGCNDYLAKPIRKEKLMEIIKKYAKC
ncbi:MAG TPA: response regulator [Bacteroidales bacterium]|nr:response regulator [Bacteroidales bacterium]HPS71198.1 response regulator [Bacteroidales bacterium]